MPGSATLLALGVVGLLSVALAVWFVVGWRKTPFTFAQYVFYLLNHCLTRVLWRTRISAPLPLPAGQGAIVIANHRSSIDPLVLQSATLRAISWLVAREYMEHKALAWVFRVVPCIPVNRGGIDTAATKFALRALQQGQVIGLFPEGRINDTQQLLLPGRPGVAMLALRARVPVVPCYIEGSPYHGSTIGPLWTPARIRVTVGQPLDFSEFYGREGERQVQEMLTLRMLGEIARLAGAADFQPELASRRWKPGHAEEPEPSAA